jgi:predicted acylesterase/phospholipase RssA
VSAAGVTLVLSGGGAKTAAHVGAVRAIEEARLVPLRYVATSMGAVVAAALASGADRDALLGRLVEVGRAGVVRDRLTLLRGLFARSLLRAGPFRRAIEQLVPARRFSELEVPITVSVVDLDTGELLLFGEGGEDAPLVDVLCASCALPVYFPAEKLAGRRCGDGGLRGPLPLEVAALLARETVVAVDVGPGFDGGKAGEGVILSEAKEAMTGHAFLRSAQDDTHRITVPPIVRAHDDAVGALMANATAAQLALWRADAGRPPLVYVRPRVERSATFRVDRVRQYADDGYRATRDALPAAGRP